MSLWGEPLTFFMMTSTFWSFCRYSSSGSSVTSFTTSSFTYVSSLMSRVSIPLRCICTPTPEVRRTPCSPRSTCWGTSGEERLEGVARDRDRLVFTLLTSSVILRDFLLTSWEPWVVSLDLSVEVHEVRFDVHGPWPPPLPSVPYPSSLPLLSSTRPNPWGFRRLS